MKASTLMYMAMSEWNQEKILEIEIDGRVYNVASIGGSKDAIIIKTRKDLMKSISFEPKQASKKAKDGLHVKYDVYKVDDGTPVSNCFVLRPSKDKAAIEALKRYAEVTDNKRLGKDILAWVEFLKREGGNESSRA